jgi:hypothetical protein
VIAKTAEKKLAIKLRKKGFSYSEIGKKILVSQSSLSLWLKKIKLNASQKERFKEKLLVAQKLGTAAIIKKRTEKVERIYRESVSEIGKIENCELFYMGLMLYWSEGTKQREKSLSHPVSFANSDLLMCKLFIKWIVNCLKVDIDRVVPKIYVHEIYRGKEDTLLEYWSKNIGIPKEKFNNVSFTNTRLSETLRHTRDEYFGQLRLTIVKSTDLNRRISGWIHGICLQSGVVE